MLYAKISAALSRIPSDFVSNRVNSSVMNWLAPYLFEGLFYGLCDIWAFICIPKTFHNYPHFFDIGLNVHLYEAKLKWTAGIAAALIYTGLTLLFWKRTLFLSSWVRAAGLGTSAAVWLALGATLLNAQSTLSSGPYLLMGFWALFFVLRWPPTPERIRRE